MSSNVKIYLGTFKYKYSDSYSNGTKRLYPHCTENEETLKASGYLSFLKSKNAAFFYIELWKNHI